MTRLHPIAVLIACLFISPILSAQDSLELADNYLSFPTRFLEKVSKKTARLEQTISNKTERALKRFLKEERRMQKKLYKKDSLLAKQVFENAGLQYQSFQATLTEKREALACRKEYIPFWDTLTTSLHFLKQAGAIKDNKQIQLALDNIKGMEGTLQHTVQIQHYLRNRRQLLKEQLSKLSMIKELKRYNKQVYYYTAQFEEYKSILKEPHKIERRAIDLLSKTKPFQDFMRKNSMLASLFRLRGNSGAATAIQPLPGLQTRTQINAILQQSAGAAGPNPAQLFQSNIQQAQSQLEQIKNKINEFGGGSDAELPAFRPNTQRVKSFWKRLELGSNIQNARNSAWLPISTDIGLSAGFKLSDQSVVGIGVAGRIGWGKDIKHIALSYEGLSTRSFLDYKLHRSFWISGGYEFNHRASFTRIEQLKALSAWQPSGLIGITKKYQIGKIKGKMSLLWDFLSYRQQPQQPAIVWRLGYGIK